MSVAPAQQSDRPIPRWAWLGLLAVIAFDVWLRAHTFGPIVRERLGVSLWPVTAAEGEPLDCDESAYAYIGRRLGHGDTMYRDLTENKPPLGYWLYALAVAIGGANELTVRVMPIPMVAATIVLVWWIALRLAGPGAACIAAFLYAVTSTDPYVFGNGANLEHAINLFAVASLALMVRALRGGGRWTIGAAGALVGAAALVKQVAIVHLIVYSICLMVRRLDSGRTFWRRLGDVGALGAGFGLAWALAVGILVAQGAGAEAFDDIVRYGGALATDTPADPHAPPFLVRWITGNADPRDGSLPWPFGPTHYYVWWGTGTWPLWVAAVPAVAWLLLGPSTGPRRLLAGWTLSAWVQVALPRLFWQHYYLLPLPGLAACVAVFLAVAGARARPSAWSKSPARALAWSLVALSLIGAILGTCVIQVRDYLLVEPEQLTARYKGGGQWVANRDLGREIGRRARGLPEPRLFVWGWQSPLFLYSGLDGVSPHFFADPLLKAYAQSDHPLIRPRIERIMRDLHARPPDLIFVGDPPFPALRTFLLENYRPASFLLKGRLVTISPDGLGLWVLKASYPQFQNPAESNALPRAPRAADSSPTSAR
jgi:hypothetical protein